MKRTLLLFTLLNALTLFGQEADTVFDSNKKKFYDLIYVNPTEAAHFSDSIVHFYEAKHDTSSTAIAMSWNGYANELLNNYDYAIDIYNRAIKLAKAIDDTVMAGNLTMYKGIAQKSNGQYDLALRTQDEAAEIFKQTGHEKMISYCYGNKGVVYNQTGQFEEALKSFERCLSIDQKLEDTRGIGLSLNNIANAYFFMGQLDKAMEYWDETRKIDSALNNLVGLSSTNRNIGLAYHDLGDFKNSEKYYLLSLVQKKALKQPKSIAKSYNNLGVMYREMGQLDQAMKMYENALRIRDSLGISPDQAESYHNMGALNFHLGNWEEALEWHYRSLKIRKELNDDSEGALSYLEIARTQYELDSVQAALVNLKKAIELGERTRYNTLTKRAYSLYYQFLRKQNKIDDAEKVIKKVLELRNRDIKINLLVLPEQKKELYLETMQEDFNQFYEFVNVYHKEYPELVQLAFNMAVQTKGLLLKSSTAMRQRVLNSGDSSLIADYEEWIALKRNIAKVYALGGETYTLEEEAGQKEKALIKKSAQLKNDLSFENLNWKLVQANLDKKEAAVEFIQFEDLEQKSHYAAIILTKKKTPEYVYLFESSTLEDRIGDFPGNNLKYIQQLYDQQAENNLYDIIWSPLEPYLRKVDKIFIAPVGLLHKVSFSALRGGDDQSIFLCQEYDIEYKYNTSTINTATASSDFSTIKSSLLMGGVNYSLDDASGPWDYLEGTAKEVQSIKDILEKEKIATTLLTQNNATEGRFKSQLEGNQVAHIATHGFFFPDPELVESDFEVESIDSINFRGVSQELEKVSIVENNNPMVRSGLVFANGNNGLHNQLGWEEDGLLTAQEIVELNLQNLQLIVLSACETGLGDIKGSEGVYGLQRAFKMAGAQQLIISLWQVPDQETSEFMIYFYEQLTEVKEVKKAFRSTQLHMSEKYDPYYWAAFVLID